MTHDGGVYRSHSPQLTGIANPACTHKHTTHENTGIWSPTGGFWADPKGWRRNTAFGVAYVPGLMHCWQPFTPCCMPHRFVVAVAVPAFIWSSKNEVRPCCAAVYAVRHTQPDTPNLIHTGLPPASHSVDSFYDVEEPGATAALQLMCVKSRVDACSDFVCNYKCLNRQSAGHNSSNQRVVIEQRAVSIGRGYERTCSPILIHRRWHPTEGADRAGALAVLIQSCITSH